MRLPWLIAATGSTKCVFTSKERELFKGYISKIENTKAYADLVLGKKAGQW